jgi:hypothetical protein
MVQTAVKETLGRKDFLEHMADLVVVEELETLVDKVGKMENKYLLLS